MHRLRLNSVRVRKETRVAGSKKRSLRRRVVSFFFALVLVCEFERVRGPPLKACHEIAPISPRCLSAVHFRLGWAVKDPFNDKGTYHARGLSRFTYPTIAVRICGLRQA